MMRPHIQDNSPNNKQPIIFEAPRQSHITPPEQGEESSVIYILCTSWAWA